VDQGIRDGAAACFVPQIFIDPAHTGAFKMVDTGNGPDAAARPGTKSG
jgi:hypothetical protein